MLKLTVITPSLNQGRFIERTIRSVLDQGYGNLEYFVVDGGSTDESVDVIRRYEDQIDWWVSEPDEGHTDALHKGLARATGDVIAFLNSDDYYLPGALEKAMGALSESDATWVVGATLHVDEHDQPRDTPVGPVWVPELPDDDSQRPQRPAGRWGLVAYPWCVAQPSSFWRRELFERYGGFRGDVPYAFDVEFMTRLAIEGEIPELLPEDELAAAVLHSEAKSADPSKWEPDWKLMRKMHSARLSRGERLRFRLWQVGQALWPITWVYNQIRFKVIHPVLRFAGKLLDHVPERIRPKIRTRDRGAS